MFTAPGSTAALVVLLALIAPAQRNPTHLVKNDPAWTLQGGFGKEVIGLRDFDGDGFADYAVAAPNWPNPGSQGRVYVYSGRTASILQTFDGTQAVSAFGESMADVGDVDGDGVRDLAIGSKFFNTPSHANAGRVQVFSGATGNVIWTRDGIGHQGELGGNLAAIGPAVGPRTLLVTERGYSGPGFIGNGRVLFLDSTSGAIIDWAPGSTTYGSLGVRMTASPEFGAAIYASDGAARVFLIAAGTGGGTGTATLSYTSPAASALTPGMAVIASPAGTPRLALGWSNVSSGGLTNNGLIQIFDAGATSPAVSIPGPHDQAFMGSKLARTFDVDGDGEQEVLTISSGIQFVAPTQLRTYDQTGNLVDFAEQAGGSSSSISSITDVTGDGRGEWINGIGTGSTTRFDVTVWSKGLSVANEVTTSVGTTWTWDLDAGPLHAGGAYLQGYSLSGAHPGTVGPAPWPLIPINIDDITQLVPLIAGGPIVPDPSGHLDGAGMTQTTLFLPAGTVNALWSIGAELTTCFVTTTPSGAVTFASSPVTIQF